MSLLRTLKTTAHLKSSSENAFYDLDLENPFFICRIMTDLYELQLFERIKRIKVKHECIMIAKSIRLLEAVSLRCKFPKKQPSKQIKSIESPQYGALLQCYFFDDGVKKEFLAFVNDVSSGRMLTLWCPSINEIVHIPMGTEIFFKKLYNLKFHCILKEAEAINTLQESPLLELILDPSTIEKITNSWSQNTSANTEFLNDVDQERIALKISKSINENGKNIFFIDGAAGTGKTRLLAGLVHQILKDSADTGRKKRILVCAPANVSTDVATAQIGLLANKYEIIRVTGFQSENKLISRKFLLEEKVSARMKKDKRHVANELPDDHMLQFKRQKCISELNTLRRQEGGCNRLIEAALDKIEKIEDDIYRDKHSADSVLAKRKKLRDVIIQTCDVVCTTLGCSKSLHVPLADVLIVDEANKATELQLLNALQPTIKHIILIGDSTQPPTMLKGFEAAKFGLADSCILRLTQKCSTFKLDRQFRMAPEIFNFPSTFFYEASSNTSSVRSVIESPINPYLVFNLRSAASHEFVMQFVIKLLLAVDRNTSSDNQQKLSCTILTLDMEFSNKITRKLSKFRYFFKIFFFHVSHTANCSILQ